MSVLSREQILGAQDLAVTPIDVPEWNGSVNLRQLAMIDIEQLNAFGGDAMRRMLGAVALSIADGEGRPLFTLADVDTLGGHSVEALKRLAQKVSEINGWIVPAERLEKNSASDPTVASSSV